MLVTKKKFYAELEWLERRNKKLDERYWELLRAHARLLQHLGLEEVAVPETTVLRAKGEPEEPTP